MYINAAKRICTHFEDIKGNVYIRRKVPVLVVRPHKDLRVTVIHDPKITVHCREVATKWLRTLQGLEQTLTTLNTTLFSIVRN